MMRRPSSHLSDPPVALLVDRDRDTRDMYTEYLSFHGYAVDQAADGREGLAKALAHHPNVVVTATRLPFIDGFRLVELLRRDRETRAIPVIVLTSDADCSESDRATS